MLLYVLIGLCLALAGVAGLQLMYMFYLDRLDKERKKRLHELERRCKALSARLESAERTIDIQTELIETIKLETGDEEAWADVLDDR